MELVEIASSRKSSHSGSSNYVEVSTFRKSQHSVSNGACVEVAEAVWHKSRHSAGNGACVELASAKWHRACSTGNCIEVAQATVDVVAFRDSKNKKGPILVLSQGAFHDLTRRIRNGSLDI